jgi:hypothetical protein
MTADELKKRMIHANLSIYDLGDMIGKSHVTVWRWACGVKTSGDRDPNRPVPVLWDQLIKEAIGNHLRIGRKKKPSTPVVWDDLIKDARKKNARKKRA